MKFKPLHDPEYKDFLSKLIKARMDVKLSQVDVAKQLNQHQSYISKCELGERRVDVIELKRFAKIYKKKIEWFVSK